MTKDEKKEVALFRYSIISELVNVKGLNWGEQERIKGHGVKSEGHGVEGHGVKSALDSL